jgi:hypothetical protein
VRSIWFIPVSAKGTGRGREDFWNFLSEFPGAALLALQGVILWTGGRLPPVVQHQPAITSIRSNTLNMKKTWIIATMLAFAVGMPAFAKKEGKKNKGGTDVFAKYDKNANGKLDPDEVEEVKKAFATDPDLKKFDTNNDGKLDDNEVAAIKPAEHKKKKKDKNAS